MQFPSNVIEVGIIALSSPAFSDYEMEVKVRNRLCPLPLGHQDGSPNKYVGP
jgi:hypothetical protein